MHSPAQGGDGHLCGPGTQRLRALPSSASLTSSSPPVPCPAMGSHHSRLPCPSLQPLAPGLQPPGPLPRGSLVCTSCAPLGQGELCKAARIQEEPLAGASTWAHVHHVSFSPSPWAITGQRALWVGPSCPGQSTLPPQQEFELLSRVGFSQGHGLRLE